MSFQYQKNTYTCRKCGGEVVTVDRDEGVTPFTILCRRTIGCNGQMESGFYKVDQSLEPEFEWYSPDSTIGYNDAVKDHLKKGGLLLRKVGEGNEQRSA